MLMMKFYSSSMNSMGTIRADELGESIEESVRGHAEQGNIVVFFDDEFVQPDEITLTNFD